MAEREKDTARPRFYMDAIQNISLSEKAGRPIFEDKEMVEIRIPGDKNWSWVGSVDEPGMHIKERFAEQYAAFKRGEMIASVGTPLEAWPPLTKSRVAELKGCHIFTVEEYAAIPDNTLGKLGIGAREEREKARAFLESAKGNAPTAALAAEVARLTAMVEQLTGKTVTPAEPKDRPIEECSDAELKEFLKRETGQPVLGNPSRETLLKRVAEVAEAKQAA